MAKNLEERVNKLENYFTVAFIVGAIFGVSGALGAAIINYEFKELAKLDSAITTTTNEVKDLREKTNFDAIHKKVSDELERITVATDGSLKAVSVQVTSAARGAAAEAIGDLQVPRGTIIVWPYSASRPIPKGWLPCDGTNGTPKLSNFAIQGAGVAVNDNHVDDRVQWYVGTSDAGDTPPPTQVTTVQGHKLSFAPLHFAPVLFIMKT